MALTVLLLPCIAIAQEAPPAPPEAPASPAALDEDPAVAAARMHFDQGMRLVRRELWEAALTEFDASIAAHPSWVALFNSALCLRNLHRYGRALDALEQLLADHVEAIDPRRRAEAAMLVAEIRGLVTPLVVRVSVDGAAVLVDDELVGASPLARPVLVPSGPHRLEVRREGFMTEHRRVVVVAGRERVEEVALIEQARLGPIRVFSNVEGAAVVIDGDEVGATPYRSVLAEGPHSVEARADGYRSASQGVTIEAGDDPLDVTLALERRRRLHRAWFWSTASLAVASALAMGGLGAAVHVLAGRYDPDADDAVERWEQGRDLMIATDVTLGVACALAASALVMAFFTDY